MFHRLKHKYKEFEGDKNIIVGKGELIWVGNGWRNIDGAIITDRNQAIELATKIDSLYRWNDMRIASKGEIK